MRCPNIKVAGLGAALPPTVPAADAINAGRYPADRAAAHDQRSATVARPDQTTPGLAVEASRAALKSAGLAPEDVSLLLHSVVNHSGLDVWASIGFLQRGLGTACLGSELRAGCAGALVAMELACAQLKARGERVALISAADTWPGPIFDRWGTDDHTIYGDGAGAAVLVRDRSPVPKAPVVASLLSVTSVIDPTLEALQRGDDPFGPGTNSADFPIDMNRRALAFRATMPRGEIGRRIRATMDAALTRSLRDAGIAMSQIDHFILPFFGRDALDRDFFKPFNVDPARSTVAFGAEIGHLGAADPLVGFWHLNETGKLTPGSYTALLAVGGGTTCGAAILRAPSHASDA